MKHAAINFILLSGVILLIVTLSFMTPISTVQRVVEPPIKSQKHIELEKKEFQTQEDMNELQQEIQQFEQRWDEKGVVEQKSPKEDLQVILERLQVVVIVTITIFFTFIKIRSFLDLLSFIISLAILTYLIPVIAVSTFLYGLIAASISTAIKLSARIKGDASLF
jgi:hypothetical protein